MTTQELIDELSKASNPDSDVVIQDETQGKLEWLTACSVYFDVEFKKTIIFVR